MKIGTLKKNEAGIHMGRITTLNFAVFIALQAVNSTIEKAPAFDVAALAADKRSWVKIGALWAFTSNDRRGIPVRPHRRSLDGQAHGSAVVPPGRRQLQRRLASAGASRQSAQHGRW